MKLKFENMTKAQKRVAIAKDVIAQIAAKRFVIGSGKYWSVEGVEWFDTIGKPFLRKKYTTCACCAAGSAVLSGVRVFNNIKVAGENGCEPSGLKNPWFSIKQLALIEAAFEDEDACYMRHHLEGDQFLKAREFVDTDQPYEGRAIAIFQNIIDNNGTFKP